MSQLAGNIMNESTNWEHYAEESLTHDDYGTRPTDIAAQLAACDRYIADHASGMVAYVALSNTGRKR